MRTLVPTALAAALALGLAHPQEHSAECAFYEAYYVEHQQRDLAAARALYQRFVDAAGAHPRAAEARAALARLDGALGLHPAPAAAAVPKPRLVELDPRAKDWPVDGAAVRPVIERLEASGDVVGALRARTRFTYAVFARQFGNLVETQDRNLAALRAELATHREAGNAREAAALEANLQQQEGSVAQERTLARQAGAVRVQEYVAGGYMGEGRSLGGLYLDAAAGPDHHWNQWCAKVRVYLTTSAKRADLASGQKETLLKLREQLSELERLLAAKDVAAAQALADRLWQFALE